MNNDNTNSRFLDNLAVFSGRTLGLGIFLSFVPFMLGYKTYRAVRKIFDEPYRIKERVVGTREKLIRALERRKYPSNGYNSPRITEMPESVRHKRALGRARKYFNDRCPDLDELYEQEEKFMNQEDLTPQQLYLEMFLGFRNSYS